MIIHFPDDCVIPMKHLYAFLASHGYRPRQLIEEGEIVIYVEPLAPGPMEAA